MSLDLAPFKTLIRTRCGLLFEGHGEEKLTQALLDRSTLLRVRPTDYYPQLLASEPEFQELVNLLTINETYFFRESEQIDLLVHRLAPRFLALHNGQSPVRILSAGCSSGEEPYSLAIALLEKYGDSVARLFTLVGADIDTQVLARARSARYSDFSFRGVAANIKNRYFDTEQRDNVLKVQVRHLVSFHELNLLAPQFSPDLRDFDIVFFRNVSIYFDAPTRKTIQQNIATLMAPCGVLVIGTAETLANDLGVLPVVEEDGLFYYVKGQAPLSPLSQYSPLTGKAAPRQVLQGWPAIAPVRPEQFCPASTPVIPAQAGIQNAPDFRLAPASTRATGNDGHSTARHQDIFTLPLPRPDLVLARRLMQDKRHEEALPQLNALLAVEPDNTEALLLKAYLLLNRKDYPTAQAQALRVLTLDAWSVDAFLLLGLVAKWRLQAGEAIGWLKKAVYACQECWPAHYYLADLYRNGGDTELARRAYRVVLGLLAGSAANTGIKHLPLDLPVGEIRFLCEHQLARMPAARPRAEQR